MENISNLYIEPTSHCNLSCTMCSRNYWKDEPIGHMEMSTFDAIMMNIPKSVHRIVFGGVGEPLCHPNIIEMIKKAKETKCTVELITNGTLLDSKMSQAIIEAGLDEIWVSLDSMHEESIDSTEDIEEVSVLDNVKAFINQMPMRHAYRLYASTKNLKKTKVGIAFVLMKSNLEEFNKLVKEAPVIGISDIIATHLIPHEPSQLDEICYERLMSIPMFRERGKQPTHVDMPLTQGQYLGESGVIEGFANPNLSVAILGNPILHKRNYCKFIEEGYVFVRWDGEVSPCIALLHDNHVVIQGVAQHNRFCTYGNVNESSLQSIWDSGEYKAFRRRVVDFTFSPCVTCGPCNLFETNETDCEGNPFPTCGACLWAQGLFQCP